jgi:hypothetical protein
VQTSEKPVNIGTDCLSLMLFGRQFASYGGSEFNAQVQSRIRCARVNDRTLLMLPEVTKRVCGIHQNVRALRDVLRARFAPFRARHQVEKAKSVNTLRESCFPVVDSSLLIVLPNCHPIRWDPLLPKLGLPYQFERLINNPAHITRKISG